MTRNQGIAIIVVLGAILALLAVPYVQPLAFAAWCVTGGGRLEGDTCSLGESHPPDELIGVYEVAIVIGALALVGAVAFYLMRRKP